ncbi:DUF1642 domain-containing protein [Streptococcus macedonicus]|uniref:DUF1642 domain-containing protein n=1 Tax=Streptococcus macedonicus TaxID=59310 RepID=UPI0022E02272|nr:DUF1642 domain-containing protein [Streptococcus macedonicus]
MNKQEAIEKIKDLWSYTLEDVPLEVDLIIKNQVLDIISQINEPRKPVVPQFVADWYENNKYDIENSIYRLCIDFREKKLRANLRGWFGDSETNSIQTLVKMKLYGYEVEKEKLYTVDIPNPNSAGGKTVLSKQQSTGRLILQVLNSDINKPKYLHLTESEIKQDFEWAWQFAKEVE